MKSTFDRNLNGMKNPDEWGVSFEGGFWNHPGNTGTEVSIHHSFTWRDEKWTVVAAYICDEGLVVDYSVEINLDRLHAFLEKWNLCKDGYESLSRIEQERIENEQPMNTGFRSKLSCNGTVLKSDTGSSMCWIPVSCHVDEHLHDMEAKRFMKHYNLDEDKAWVLWRCAYRWNQKEVQLKDLEISFVRDKKRIALNPIGNLRKGAAASICHPVTGQKHTITALEVSDGICGSSAFSNPGLEYPAHFRTMEYSIEPDIDGLSFAVQDAVEGDSPRMKGQSSEKPAAMAVSMIGGTRGHTGTNTKNIRSACSSMHYSDEYEVNWMPVFFVKELDDIVIRIKLEH